MNTYEHLPLTPYQGEVQRQTRRGGGGFKNVDERIKSDYSRKALEIHVLASAENRKKLRGRIKSCWGKEKYE